MITYCDPPRGWVYGFPKILPDNRKDDVLIWLVEEGYPQSEIDSYGLHFHCSYFTV